MLLGRDAGAAEAGRVKRAEPLTGEKIPVVCPLYSWIRCGARSRNLACMRVVHRSGGSSTWESAESTWLAMRSFLSFSGSPLWLRR